MVNSEKLIGITEYLTLYTRFRINRCRYNRVRLYFNEKTEEHVCVCVFIYIYIYVYIDICMYIYMYFFVKGPAVDATEAPQP
jgi:hypothetical protein